MLSFNFSDLFRDKSYFCNMKAISIFLGLIFFLGSLLPKFDLDELGQIDELYEHYQIHAKQSNGDLSFEDFLVMHYSDKNHDKSENHDQLPFHNHDCNLNITLALNPEISFSFKSLPSDKLHVSFYESVNYSEYSASIWQPPKL